MGAFSSIQISHVLFLPLKAELNPTCHLLALLILEAHHILHVSKIRFNYCQQDTIKLRILMTLFKILRVVKIRSRYQVSFSCVELSTVV
jgi:phosphatidylserine synthase